jgi:hypothetical protein
MTIAFMSMVAAIIAERISLRVGLWAATHSHSCWDEQRVAVVRK